jgi:hypothetical protein
VAVATRRAVDGTSALFFDDVGDGALGTVSWLSGTAQPLESRHSFLHSCSSDLRMRSSNISCVCSSDGHLQLTSQPITQAVVVCRSDWRLFYLDYYPFNEVLCCSVTVPHLARSAMKRSTKRKWVDFHLCLCLLRAHAHR